MRTIDRRLAAAEGATGLKYKKRSLDKQKAEMLDDWLKAVTRRRLSEMSNSELTRLERLFTKDAPVCDDVAERVSAAMDEHQHVIDLDLVRSRMDLGR